jgi:predicted ABC-type ATPase
MKLWNRRMVELPKRILVLAGPNGAGKTTFAREFLIPEASCPTFLNADLIAADLSPHDPARAAMRSARLMLHAMDEAASTGASFAFETTLANRGYARRFRDWRAAGYHLTVLYLAVPTVELAIQRVAERIAQGGHAIPEDVIRRRFLTGRANFDNLYRGLAHEWIVYDNAERAPVLLDWGENP